MTWFPNTYFMNQRFAIDLIIEFVETVNREVKETVLFYVVLQSLEYCYLQTFH